MDAIRLRPYVQCACAPTAIRATWNIAGGLSNNYAPVAVDGLRDRWVSRGARCTDGHLKDSPPTQPVHLYGGHTRDGWGMQEEHRNNSARTLNNSQSIPRFHRRNGGADPTPPGRKNAVWHVNSLSWDPNLWNSQRNGYPRHRPSAARCTRKWNKKQRGAAPSRVIKECTTSIRPGHPAAHHFRLSRCGCAAAGA
ncbi:unnamed protein product [Heligmosomoides polygyrus]|uniref:Secreted protein n=1 Tax=Heligmosomoides polygyrus TaxID=6339 RepID=A0A183GME5_HELPZ|nr:unnamed protein product [Heligmosomoides polygyrus]